MKNLILTLSLLTGLTSFAQTVPSECGNLNWPVTAITKADSPNDISIRFNRAVYPNLKNMANMDVEFSDERFYNYMKIVPVTDNSHFTLNANFIERHQDGTAGTKELNVLLGTIAEVKTVKSMTCYKVDINPAVAVTEIIVKTKGDCWPLGSFLCPKEKTAWLELITKPAGPTIYRYRSNGGVSVRN